MAPGSTPLTMLYLCYDGDTTPRCRPRPPVRGLVTATRAMDDTSGSYATSRTAYDPWGNPTATTDPNGGTWSTTFDAQNHIYPVMECNPLRRCTRLARWDRTAEAPTVVADRNGAITRYAFDALGRLASATSASGGTTAATYSESSSSGAIEHDRTVVHGTVLWSNSYTDGLGDTTGRRAPPSSRTRDRHEDPI